MTLYGWDEPRQPPPQPGSTPRPAPWWPAGADRGSPGGAAPAG